MLSILKKKKQKNINPIHGFDYISFRLANEDLAGYSDREADQYLQRQGLNELKNGKRKFHKEFMPFNDEKYLERFVDLRDAITKGMFESAFHHFKLFGYHEIITSQRGWSQHIDCISREERKENNTASAEHFLIENILRETVYQEFIDSLDMEKYLKTNIDIFNAIEHKTLESVDAHFRAMGLQELYNGERKLIQGVELYNEEVYLLTKSDIKENLGEEGFVSGFEHFLIFGYKEFLSAECKQADEKAVALKPNNDLQSIDRLTIEQSGLFDEAFYLSAYPDVMEANIDPIMHYLMYGADEKRNVSDTFDTEYYVNKYPDVQNSGLNPLVHYILVGQVEEREIQGKDLCMDDIEFIIYPFSDKYLIDIESLKNKMEKQEIFSNEYYLETNKDVKHSGIDPFKHFIFFGIFEKRNPSAVFDIDFYAKHYFDIYVKRINPIEHYIDYGKGQGLRTSPINFKSIVHKNHDDETIVFICESPKPNSHNMALLEKIRVIYQHFNLHVKVIFYQNGDLLSDYNNLCDTLVLSDGINMIEPRKQLHMNFIKNFIGHDTRLFYFDFFNMDLIKCIDNHFTAPILLYLSEKKYSAFIYNIDEEQKVIIDIFLVDSENAALQLKSIDGFEDKPILIESPTYFSYQEISKNLRTVVKLIEESVLKEDVFQSFQRINQMSHRKEEILKSSIGLSSTNNSVTTIQYFTSLIEYMDIVSFDIFDTLVERNYINPHAIFSAIEFEAKTNKLINFDFKSFRIEAELEARKTLRKNEITLEDIYETLSNSFKIDQKTTQYLMSQEKEHEYQAIVEKPYGIELLRAAQKLGKKIIFISDMYLSKELIQNILQRNNLLFENVELFISCELQQTKHQGGLFDLIMSQKKIQNKQWVHIGDNLHSDVAVPFSKGIKTFYMQSSANAFVAKNQHLAYHLGHNDSKDDLIASSVFGTISNAYYGNNERRKSTSRFDGDPIRIGFEALGPVFLGFLHYLYTTIKKQRYEKVFFIARDGYYLKLLYDRLRKMDKSLPESTYFFSSRIMSYTSSFHNEESVRIVAEKDYFPTTLHHLLTVRFNFTDEMFLKTEKDLETFGFNGFDDDVLQHINHTQYVDFVIKQHKLIIQSNKKNTKNFYEYIEQSGLNNRCAIVDIGYAGSLQLTINHLTKNKVDAIYFITNEKVKALETKNIRHYAYIDYDHALTPDFFRYVQLFELFFSPTHASTKRIEKTKPGTFSPIYDELTFGQNTNIALAKLHEGAVKFVETYLQNHENIFQTVDKFTPEIMLVNLLSFFAEPDLQDCLPFNEVIFEDNFGANKYPLITTDLNILNMDDIAMSLFGYWASASRKHFEANISPATSYDSHSVYCIDKVTDAATLVPAYLTPDYAETNKYSEVIRPLPYFHFAISINGNWDPKILESLNNQLYPYWQATIIFNEEDISSEIIQLFAAYVNINITKSSENNMLFHSISEEWIIYADNSVFFEPDFLAEIYRTFTNQTCDLIYVDEDYFDGNIYGNPAFKPDFSPELLLSQPYYMGNVLCVKSSALHSVNINYDSPIAFLSFYALKNKLKVVHVPQLLVHNLIEKTDVSDYIPFIENYLNNAQIKFKRVYRQKFSLTEKRPVYSVEFPDEGPQIGFIIPTKNKLDVLKTCLDSLEITTYKNYTVYIVDNESDEDDILEFFRNTKHNVLHIASCNGVFSYSYVNNEAAKLVKEDYLLFLNNDVEVITPQWMSQMAGLIQIDGIGSVGARLYYGNDKLQHVGIVNKIAPYGLPAPAFKLIEGIDSGYLNYAKSIKNFSAMTAACMLTPKKVFFEMGGFDDIDFSVAYNDCDYGFKLIQNGYRNVVAPNAELYHFEGVTRGIGVGNDKPSEEAAFIQKYKNWQDPYYNPNLTEKNTNFEIQPIMYRTTPNQSFRCLMIGHNLEYEGAPLIQFEIAKGLKKEFGIEIIILTPMDGPLREAYELEDIEVHYLNDDNFELFSSNDLHEYNEHLQKIEQKINFINVDVIFANTILSYWAIEAAKKLGIPSVWLIHESEPPFEHLRHYSKLIESHGKEVISYSYKNIFVAESTRELFEKFNYKNNFMTIYNGFDSSRITIHISEENRIQARDELKIADKFTFICPGVVSKRKAQIDALKAFELLPENIKSATVLMIVGDRSSEYSDELHKYYSNMDEVCQKNIKIIKETKDIGRYYNASDAFLFTSHLESFPKVIQEAMYLKLPIVSTNVFGIAEQVHDRSSALLCEPEDIEALSLNMKMLIEDSKLREKLIENAYNALGKLPNYNEMIEEYNEILQQAYLN